MPRVDQFSDFAGTGSTYVAPKLILRENIRIVVTYVEDPFNFFFRPAKNPDFAFTPNLDPLLRRRRFDSTNS